MQQGSPRRSGTGTGRPMYHSEPGKSSPPGKFPARCGSRSCQCRSAPARPKGLILTRCGQWEGWREDAHSTCRIPGLQFSDCEPRPDQRTGGARSARGEPQEGREKRDPRSGGAKPHPNGHRAPRSPQRGRRGGGERGENPGHPTRLKRATVRAWASPRAQAAHARTRSHGRHAPASGRSTRAAKKPLPPRKREYGGSGGSTRTRSRTERALRSERRTAQAKTPTKDGSGTARPRAQQGRPTEAHSEARGRASRPDASERSRSRDSGAQAPERRVGVERSG